MTKKDPAHTMIDTLTEGLTALLDLVKGAEKTIGNHSGEGSVGGRDFKVETRFNTRTASRAEESGEREETRFVPRPPLRETRARKAPLMGEDHEPVVDVFDETAEVLVVTELPGTREDDIHCTLDGDILVIEAQAAHRAFHHEVLLPAPLAAEAAPAWTLYNDVLEVRLKKADPEAGPREEDGSSESTPEK